MLAPDDRITLRDQLRPPDGFELNFAVATSFTLDLDAVLVAPLAFAPSGLDAVHDPVALMEAARRTTNRLAVFSQVGHVRVPSKYSPLMEFLEPVLHEVQPIAPGYLFHPKIWVVRYIAADGATRIRLICGSRNLTNDTSWDAVVTLDGTPTGRRQRESNRPLRELVRHLPTITTRSLPSDLVGQIEQLAIDAGRTEWHQPDLIELVSFHALGIDLDGAEKDWASALEGDRRLAISPFLDADTVNSLATECDLTLVSRSEAMDALGAEPFEGVTTKVVTSTAHLDVEPEQTESGRSLMGGLHAKVYVIEWGKRTRLVLGSANATAAGFRDRNVEFGVALKGPRKLIGIDAFLGPQAPFASLLATHEVNATCPTDTDDELGRSLEAELRKLAKVRFTVECIPDETTARHRLRLASDRPVELRRERSLQIELLTLPGRGARHTTGAIEIEFDGVATVDVTPFVALTISEGSGSRRCVVRAELVNEPDDRLDRIVAQTISSPGAFRRYLALCLGWEPARSVGAGGPIAGGVPAGDTVAARFGDDLFEQLLRTAAQNPEQVRALQGTVERLATTADGRATFPPGFEQLWAAVTGAVSTTPGEGRLR